MTTTTPTVSGPGGSTLPEGPFESIEEYVTAVDRIRAAAQAYYHGEPEQMDDATYDALVRQVQSTEVAKPQWKVADSPTEVVAGGAAVDGNVPHSEPMLSLDNVFSPDELRDWAERLFRAVGRPVSRFTVEPKIDGLAVAARYVDGKLVQVLTRGTGLVGEDVTAQARHVAGLPDTLSSPVTIEVRGEVHMTKADFEKAQEIRVANGGTSFSNERNAAAGSLRAQNRTYVVPLSFLAYAVHGLPEGSAEAESHAAAMAYIAGLGVATTAQSEAGMPVCATVDELVDVVLRLEVMKPGLAFIIDGGVIKCDLTTDRVEAGASSRAPKWGIAYKYPPDTRETTLVSIELQIGRTGIITPVAKLAPIEVGGVTVTSATLHNFADLLVRDVRVGDKVYVRRAGEVIPEIVGANHGARTPDIVAFESPEVCPNCGDAIDKTHKRWRCVRGRKCHAATSVTYAVSRDCLDIDGLGSKLIVKLIDAGMIQDVADLFVLDVPTLAALDRMGDTLAGKLVANIQAAKQQTFARVLTALGVQGTGRSLSRRIAKHFGSMAALQAATAEQLQAVEGIGREKTVLILAELEELAPVIAKLAERGVNLSDEQPAGVAGGAVLPLVKADGTAMTVVVTGSVPGLTRNEGNEAVEKLGGRSSSSVSAKTDLVVVGDGAGSKADKAASLKRPILPADRFAELLKAALAGDGDRAAVILAEAVSA
jgi:DNA ligase (NAD+)